MGAGQREVVCRPRHMHSVDPRNIGPPKFSRHARADDTLPSFLNSQNIHRPAQRVKQASHQLLRSNSLLATPQPKTDWMPRTTPQGILVMKVRIVIRLLLEDGWRQVGQSGSHRQFKHPIKPGRVTIAGKPNDDIAPGTLRSIERQSDVEMGRR